MKHTDFYNQYKYLDACTENELKAAVKAHGNEYVFIHTDDDEHISEEKQNAPIISASTKCMASYEYNRQNEKCNFEKRKVHFLVFSGHFGRVCLTAVQSSLKRCLIG